MIPTITNYKSAIEQFLVRFSCDGEKPVKLYIDKGLRDKLRAETYVTQAPAPIGLNDGVLCGLPYKVHDGNWGELTVEGEHGTVKIQFFNS